MHRVFSRWAARGAFVLLASALVSAQQPTFKTGVDIVRVDVVVVDDDGKPVDSLAAGEFAVRVNGILRPVTTLTYLEFPGLTQAHTLGARLASGSSAPSVGGRTIVVAVDEESLPRTDNARPLMQTIAGWIERLTPADRMAIVALPPPGIRQKLTNDKAALTRTLYKLHARSPVRESRMGTTGFGSNGPSTASPRPDAPGGGNKVFFGPEAFTTLSDQGVLLMALEDLAASLVKIDGPKTLILVSSTLGFDSSLLSQYRAIASRASEARLRMYVLQPHVGAGAATGNADEQLADSRGATPEGLHFLAGLTGGAVLQAVARSEAVVARVERETTGVYVLGLDLPPGTPRDKPLEVKVEVTRAGLTVRSPEQVVIPRHR